MVRAFDCLPWRIVTLATHPMPGQGDGADHCDKSSPHPDITLATPRSAAIVCAPTIMATPRTINPTAVAYGFRFP
jgi:hypothetical protein